MGLPKQARPTEDQCMWGVVEDNETYKIFVDFRPGASHISFRDNVIHYDAGLAIDVETQFTDVPRLTQDLRFDHNTFISSGAGANFLQINGPGKDISVTNNLMIAPNIKWVGGGAGALIIAGTDLSSFSEISNNIWPAAPASAKQPGDNYLYPTLNVGTRGYVPNSQWAQYSQVQGEQYDNADLSDGQYSLTLNGVTAGALPSVFNTNDYTVAVKAAA